MEHRVSNSGKCDDKSFDQRSEVLEHAQVQPYREMKDQSRSRSHASSDREMNPVSEEIQDHVRYGKLYKALQENDWKSVDDFIARNPDALTTIIRVHDRDTIFHIITRKLGAPLWLIKKLVLMVPPERLEQLRDEFDRTAFHFAASIGNKQAAEAFLGRNKNLPNVRTFYGFLPIYSAVICEHKEMVQYLLDVTTAPLNDDYGFPLLQSLIDTCRYGN